LKIEGNIIIYEKGRIPIIGHIFGVKGVKIEN
jgi:hypothetical protein